MKKALLIIISCYQRTISQFRPHSCRFVPTCSQYTFESIERYGAIRGVWAGVRRVARCHPFHEGGYDPVR